MHAVMHAPPLPLPCRYCGVPVMYVPNVSSDCSKRNAYGGGRRSTDTHTLKVQENSFASQYVGERDQERWHSMEGPPTAAAEIRKKSGVNKPTQKAYKSPQGKKKPTKRKSICKSIKNL